MVRIRGKLTEQRIEKLIERGLYFDSPNLYVRVGPTGAKSYVVRIQVNRRRVDKCLGPVWAVPLQEARAKALDIRKEAWLGRCPVPGRPTPGGAGSSSAAPIFKEAAKRAHREKAPDWKNEKHAQQWLATLERYAFPIIGRMPVDQITGRDMLRLLTPIWNTKQETARRVRQRCHSVFGWAIAQQYIDTNPAGEQIDGALPKHRNGKKNHRAMPHAEVSGALATVEASKAKPASKLALRFLVLTACRSGEARGARWSEIDLERALWVIPGERMKADREHRVPLSDSAVQVLAQAKALDDGSGLVFPSQRRRELSDMTLTKLLRDTGLAERATVHGFRSSFRMWCADTNKEREQAEAALAHTVKGVEGRYQRSDVLDLRRSLMQGWTDYLEGRQQERGRRGYQAHSWGQFRAS